MKKVKGMGTYPSGTYYYRSTIGGKRQYHNLKTRNKDIAAQRALKIERAIKSGNDPDVAASVLETVASRVRGAESSSLPIGDAWAKYKDSPRRRGRSERQMAEYSRWWDQFTEWAPSNIRTLQDVSERVADKYARWLGERYSPNSASKRLTLLRSVWRLCGKGSNPWEGLRPVNRRRKLGKRPFTVDQIRQVIAHADESTRPLHILMAYTGLRMGDACTIRIDDIDLSRGIIEMIPRKTRDRSDPMMAKIGIHPALRPVLTRHLAGRSSGPLFEHAAKAYKQDPSSISKRLQRDVEKAGIETTEKPKGGTRTLAVYGAHSYRKAISDLMREAGIDVMVRMAILAHTDQNSLTQTYSHVSDREVIEAVERSLPDFVSIPVLRQEAREA